MPTSNQCQTQVGDNGQNFRAPQWTNSGRQRHLGDVCRKLMLDISLLGVAKPDECVGSRGWRAAIPTYYGGRRPHGLGQEGSKYLPVFDRVDRCRGSLKAIWTDVQHERRRRRRPIPEICTSRMRTFSRDKNAEQQIAALRRAISKDLADGQRPR